MDMICITGRPPNKVTVEHKRDPKTAVFRPDITKAYLKHSKKNIRKIYGWIETLYTAFTWEQDGVWFYHEVFDDFIDIASLMDVISLQHADCLTLSNDDPQVAALLGLGSTASIPAPATSSSSSTAPSTEPSTAHSTETTSVLSAPVVNSGAGASLSHFAWSHSEKLVLQEQLRAATSEQIDDVVRFLHPEKGAKNGKKLMKDIEVDLSLLNDEQLSRIRQMLKSEDLFSDDDDDLSNSEHGKDKESDAKVKRMEMELAAVKTKLAEQEARHKSEVLLHKKAAEDATSRVSDAQQIAFEEGRRRKELEAIIKKSSSGSSGASLPIKHAYLRLMQHVYTSYDKKKADAFTNKRKKGRFKKEEVFEFEESSGNMQPFTDKKAISELQKLISKSTVSVSYRIGSHNYTCVPGSNKDEFVQTNVTTGVARKVVRSMKSEDEEIQGKKTKCEEVLFGNSFVTISREFVQELLSYYDFADQTILSEPSLELAELAQLFSAFSGGFKYLSGSVHNSKIFIKPALFYAWLSAALHRQYTSLRLAMHGSDSNSYTLIESDPLGFSLKNSGRHGRAYGDGLYLGLSDQIPASYNTDGKPGTAILALVMTSDSLDQNKHFDGSYKTFRLSPNIKSIVGTSTRANCIVCHDMMISLVLGKVAVL
jgi:hypothetical protein